MGETLVSTHQTSKAPIAIELLSTEKFDLYWPCIRGVLEDNRRLWEDRYSLEYFRMAVLSGHLQVWAFGDRHNIYLVAFTQICIFPVSRELNIFFVFGHLAEDDEAMENIIAVLERFAIEQECSRMTGVGREGWVRKMRKFGVTKLESVVSRPVFGRMH